MTRRKKSKKISNQQKKKDSIEKSKQKITEEEVQRQVRETLEKLQGISSKSVKKNKYDRSLKNPFDDQENEKKIEVLESISVTNLSSLMEVKVTDVISASMSLGIMLTTNQILDNETVTLLANEFGFDVDFVTVKEKEFNDKGNQKSGKIKDLILEESIVDQKVKPIKEISVTIDIGNAKPDLIAEILSDLSILYRLEAGGSGLNFELTKTGSLIYENAYD